MIITHAVRARLEDDVQPQAVRHIFLTPFLALCDKDHVPIGEPAQHEFNHVPLEVSSIAG